MQSRVQRTARLLAKSNYTVALTGAGISTPSGIPDFRSPGSGLWSHVDPLEVASIVAFYNHPERFFHWFRPLARSLLNAKPNPAHLALAELEWMNLLHRVITQNVDALHQKAGSRLVLEMHGHLRTATCLNCGQVVPTDRLWEPYLIDRQMPRCASCGGVLKPDVVLFGEPVPYEPLAQAQEDALRCDVMLVIGSSLEIMPAADLPFLARRHGAHVIVVNYQPTAVDKLADVVFHEDVIAVLPQLVETCRADLS